MSLLLLFGGPSGGVLNATQANNTVVSTGTVTGFVAEAHSTSGPGVTSRTVNVPTGTVDGDVMIAVVMVELEAGTVTPPSGWTLLINTPLSTKVHTQLIYARIASSEPANYTWSWSSCECGVAILTYRNVAFPSVYNSQYNIATTTDCTAPSLTTPVDNSWSLWIGTIAYGTTWTPPTGYLERLDIRTSTASTNMAMSVADKFVATAGSTGAPVGTAADADWSVGSALVLVPYAGPVGAAALTQGGDTLAAAGTVADPSATGTLTATQAANTLSSAGAVAVVGTLTATQAGDTLAAAGVVAVVGGATLTQDANTSVAAGVVVAGGALTQTQDANTVASAGVVLVTGAAALTQDGNTLDASGTVQAVVSLGTLTQAQDGNTVVASGLVLVSGTLAQAQAGNSLNAAGVVAVTGGAALTQAGDTLATTGLALVLGTLAQAQAGDTVSAAGAVAVAGAAALAQDGNTIAAVGVVLVSGRAALVQEGDTLAAGGTVAIAGNAAIAQADNTPAATGDVYDVGGAADIHQVGDALAASMIVAWVGVLGTVRGVGPPRGVVYVAGSSTAYGAEYDNVVEGMDAPGAVSGAQNRP